MSVSCLLFSVFNSSILLTLSRFIHLSKGWYIPVCAKGSTVKAGIGREGASFCFRRSSSISIRFFRDSIRFA